MNEPMATLSKLPAATWFLVAGAVVLGWGLSWAWRWYRRRRTQKALIAALTASASDYVHDVLVSDGMGGYFHVDFILLTPRGILVIDLRDVRGNIFGGDQMTEWTVMDGPQRFTFTNPQGALYDRIAAVRAVAGDPPTEGRIVSQGITQVDAHGRYPAHGVSSGRSGGAGERGAFRCALAALEERGVAELHQSDTRERHTTYSLRSPEVRAGWCAARQSTR